MIDEVLEKITPTKDEADSLELTVRSLIKKVRSEFGKIGIDVTVNVFGSVSRGTWLARENDIDLFVAFPTNFSKDRLEELVTKVGRGVLKDPEKWFAEHPYIKGGYDGHTVEIIPCYRVGDASKRISAVDRTPFHDKFVKENLKGRGSDVRLLKQFMKGIGCYGAEVRVEGFSGYLCELLIIKFGSFQGVLEAASAWNPPVVVDMRGSAEPETFQGSHLVFIDPTDSGRNVASALSQENLSLFIHAAKTFLRKPFETYFFPKTRTMNRKELMDISRARGSGILTIAFQKPVVIDDILYSQLKKAERFFTSLLEAGDFTVLNSGFTVDGQVIMAFELQHVELPPIKAHTGPPVNSKNEDGFLTKHRASEKALTRPFIKGSRWMVYLRREHTRAGGLLESFLSQKGLRKRGVPGHIAKAIESGFEIKTDQDALEGGTAFFADLLQPVFPWEAR